MLPWLLGKEAWEMGRDLPETPDALLLHVQTAGQRQSLTTESFVHRLRPTTPPQWILRCLLLQCASPSVCRRTRCTQTREPSPTFDCGNTRVAAWTGACQSTQTMGSSHCCCKMGVAVCRRGTSKGAGWTFHTASQPGHQHWSVAELVDRQRVPCDVSSVAQQP